MAAGPTSQKVKFDGNIAMQALIESGYLSNHMFSRYKSKEKKKPLKRMISKIFGGGKLKAVKASLDFMGTEKQAEPAFCPWLIAAMGFLRHYSFSCFETSVW